MQTATSLEYQSVWQSRWGRSVKSPFLVALALILILAAPAVARRVDWTNWYSLDDTHAKLIHVRFLHTQRGDIQYQFRNMYRDQVAIKYRVTRDNGQLVKDGATAIAAGGMSYVSEGLIEGEKNVWITIVELRKAGTGDELPRVR